MSRLIVFSTGETALLAESCARFTVPFFDYRAGWQGFVETKTRAGLKAVEKLSAEFVMWTDGNDSLVLACEDRIVRGFEESGAKVLIAAERNCYPDADIAHRYPEVPDGLPRFINAGGYMGRRSDLMQMMRVVLDNAVTGDDQREWTKVYLAGLVPGLKLDHERRVFACIADGQDAIKCDAPIKHWNGRVEGRKEYWEQCIR